MTDSDQGTAACCLQCLTQVETSAKQTITAHVTPVVLAVVVIKLQVFWDVMLCQLVNSFQTSLMLKREASSSSKITVTIQESNIPDEESLLLHMLKSNSNLSIQHSEI